MGQKKKGLWNCFGKTALFSFAVLQNSCNDGNIHICYLNRYHSLSTFYPVTYLFGVDDNLIKLFYIHEFTPL